jgi:hypothetical protein
MRPRDKEQAGRKGAPYLCIRLIAHLNLEEAMLRPRVAGEVREVLE